MRLPATMKLRDGLKWTGWLTVCSAVKGGYVVAFDAEVPNCVPGLHRVVYDRTVLTRQQIIDWTGVDLEAAR